MQKEETDLEESQTQEEENVDTCLVQMIWFERRTLKLKTFGQVVWRLAPVTPALWRQKQEDFGILSYLHIKASLVM